MEYRKSENFLLLKYFNLLTLNITGIMSGIQ